MNPEYVDGGHDLFRKAISHKRDSTKNGLRGPNLFLQEHLHYLRRRWFDL